MLSKEKPVPVCGLHLESDLLKVSVWGMEK